MNASTPAGFLAALLASAGSVLPWVGVAVSAGMALFGVFLGIKVGIRFFGRVADVPEVEGYDTYEPGPAGANPDPTEWEVGR